MTVRHACIYSAKDCRRYLALIHHYFSLQGSKSLNVLNDRVKKLEASERILEDRLHSLERENLLAMKDGAVVAAENHRLKRKLDSMKYGSHQSQFSIPQLVTSQVESQPRRVSMEHITESTMVLNKDVPGSTDINIEHRDAVTYSSEEEQSNERDGFQAAGQSTKRERRVKTKHIEKNVSKVGVIIPWKNRLWDPTKFYIYPCPVIGCSHEFAFGKKLNPPLKEDGTVSDVSFWKHKKFRTRVQRVRDHMKSKHADFDEALWPAGFAYVVTPEKRRKVTQRRPQENGKDDEDVIKSHSIRTKIHQDGATITISGLELLAKEAKLVAAVLNELAGDVPNVEQGITDESIICGLDFY